MKRSLKKAEIEGLARARAFAQLLLLDADESVAMCGDTGHGSIAPDFAQKSSLAELFGQMSTDPEEVRIGTDGAPKVGVGPEGDIHI